MPFIVKHTESGKYVARKGVDKGVKFRLTDDIGSAQMFNTVGSTTSTIKIMKSDFARWRGWSKNHAAHTAYYKDLPESDEFDVYPVVDIVLGEKL